jgi:hypothetical protein
MLKKDFKKRKTRTKNTSTNTNSTFEEKLVLPTIQIAKIQNSDLDIQGKNQINRKNYNAQSNGSSCKTQIKVNSIDM